MSDQPSNTPPQPDPDQTRLTTNLERDSLPQTKAEQNNKSEPHSTPSAPLPKDTETFAPDDEGTADVDAWAKALGSLASEETSRAEVRIPGYEIIRELGRGGMGVVYQAKQDQLNRMVALKMILSGAHAGPNELARFRIEAEAVARLQHPNIVQIHDIGEHEGLPFFSLEFCSGGALDSRLADHPMAPHEAAHLVEQLARAMHAAHDANVIHRDLKPANVLMDAEGSPKITDFGLAKKLDEAGQTHSGAIMGTPSYMAPEQAQGELNRIGPHTDTYALGAILYDCLTGRPPFKAATAMDTVMQVIRTEPTPPTRLQPDVPRDLETICLKCLNKEPEKRYASALDLAEDLRRFQANEPIQARPVSRGERLIKWGRRNPAVAVLLALVLLVLITGVTVSSILAVQASRRADEANHAKALAVTEKENAKASEAQAVEANQKLEKSNDNLLSTVARSLIRPLGSGIRGSADTISPLTGPESDALQELAATPEEQLRLRFVREALRSASATHQLRSRARPALLATIGLSPRIRGAIENILLEKLSNKELAADHRLDVALLASNLSRLTRETATEITRHLAQTISTTKNYPALPMLCRQLSRVAHQLDSRDAATVCTRGAASLIASLSRSSLGVNGKSLSANLKMLVIHLKPEDAAQVSTIVVKAMERTDDPLTLYSLAQALVVLVPRLSPNEAASFCTEVAGRLSRAIVQSTDPQIKSSLSEPLPTLVSKIKPEEAALICFQVSMAKAREANKSPRFGAHVGTASTTYQLAGFMKPDAVTKVCQVLIEAMKKTSDNNVIGYLAYGVAQMADHLTPEAAARLVKDLQPVMGALPSHPYGHDLFTALTARTRGAVAARMTIIPFQIQRTTSGTLGAVSRGFSLAATRMSPEEAAQALAVLQQNLVETKDAHFKEYLSWCILEITKYVDPEKARRACTETAAHLAGLIKETKNPFALSQYAQGLSRLAFRMELAERASICEQAVTTLKQALEKTIDPQQVQSLTQGLFSLSVRLPEVDAQRTCTEAGKPLTQALQTANAPNAIRSLCQTLAFLGSRMKPENKAQASLTLLHALSKAENFITINQIPVVFGTLASGMKPQTAERVAKEMILAMKATKHPLAMRSLPEALSLLIDRMTPEKSSAICSEGTKFLVDKMQSTVNQDSLQKASFGVVSLAKQCKPEDTAAMAHTLVQVLAKTNDFGAQEHLARALSSLAPRMDPEDTGKAFTALVRGLNNSRLTVIQPQGTSGQCLRAVVRRMPPKEAEQTTEAILQNLNQRTMSSGAKTVLSWVLAETAGLVPLQKHSRLVLLIQALHNAPTEDARRFLSHALEQALVDVNTSERQRRGTAIVASLGNLAGNCSSPTSLMLIAPAIQPLPCHLSDQELVNLLKQPTSVGVGQRILLNQLQNRHSQTFGNRWDFVDFAKRRGLALDFDNPAESDLMSFDKQVG